MKIYDISLPLDKTLPLWPGGKQIEVMQSKSIERGDISNVSRLIMSIHSGTHIDSPKHFIDNGKSVDKIQLDKLIGHALVLEVSDQVSIISKDDIKQALSYPGIKKILFKTRNSKLWKSNAGTFEKDYVGISFECANFLVESGFDLIGIDYLSIAPYNDIVNPHKILLLAEVIIIEGLDLSDVSPGLYTLFCLPLKLIGTEGAPARVVLIQDD